MCGKQAEETRRHAAVGGMWRLAKFRGIHKSTFCLHLKETEWRFNHRHENLYLVLLKEFRVTPL
jgi:transposase-like protein